MVSCRREHQESDPSFSIWSRMGCHYTILPRCLLILVVHELFDLSECSAGVLLGVSGALM